MWELQIWQEDGTLRSLSGTSARETKQRLESLLRMDYKTFLASAYLAQGRADEFTRAPVAERKKVLADILDLSRYEALEQMAKDKRAEAEARELDAEREMRAIDSELAYEPEHRSALQAAEATLATLTAEVEALHKDRQALATRIQYLAEREEKAQEYEAGIKEREEWVAHAQEELRDAEESITGAEQIRSRRGEIEQAYAALQALQARIGPLEAQYATVLNLERTAATLDKQIHDEQEALDRERYRLQCDVTGLGQEARELPRWDAEVVRLDAQIVDLGDPERRRQDAEQERQQAEDAFVKRKAEHETLKAQIERLAKRIDALQSSDAPLCDWCGQPLSPAKRRQAREEAEAEQQAHQAKLKECAARGMEWKKRGEKARQDAERAQAELRTLAKLEAQRAQATQEQLRLSERCKTLPSLEERLARQEQRLKERDYAHEAQEQLMQVSARLEKLERVVQELADARAERERLSDAERNVLLLGAADRTLASATQQANKARERVEKWQAQIAKAQAAIAKIRQETEALPARQAEIGALDAQIKARQEEVQGAQREIGHRTARLAHCADLKVQRARRLQEQQAAAKEKDVYKELVGAFGKRGVQALIIENALPEIQDVANEILGRMTDGGMQVQLLAQREAKSRGAGAIETLDIIISDDMGTRPYEMYSGGEAFRVNFALRIALSKMLARRAGAPLQTLILDEGFGTQDPRGRESIVDAINTVADDFALLLVITHIEELKDQFQTRIEVVKGPGGSTFTVA